MTNLNFPADSFDQNNTFSFAYQGFRGQERTATGYLFRDGDQIFVMKQSDCLKGAYTDADRAERARLSAMRPLRTGDTVQVEGKAYTVKILGDYSDAGRLIPA